MLQVPAVLADSECFARKGKGVSAIASKHTIDNDEKISSSRRSVLSTTHNPKLRDSCCCYPCRRSAALDGLFRASPTSMIVLLLVLWTPYSDAFVMRSNRGAFWPKQKITKRVLPFAPPFQFTWEKEDAQTANFRRGVDRQNSLPVSATRVDRNLFDKDEDEDDINEQDGSNIDDGRNEEGRLRKRDRIKDWLFTHPPNTGSSSSGDEGNPSRLKTKFDNLFSGMPSMTDILSDKPGASSTSGRRKGKEGDDEPEWFRQEKQRIMDSFEAILQDTMDKLEKQRQQDPESVPENAEGIVKSILKQEMDAEIASAKEELSLRRLQEYESQQRSFVDKQDISNGPIDDQLQRLMDESEDEYAQMEASRLQLEEFLRYEAEAFRRAAIEQTAEAENPIARPQGDLDEWALERLQEMANNRQDVDGGEVVLDILDEITEDLKNRMEKEKAKKGSIETKTLKEWQMFRAISTKLGKQRGQGEAAGEEVVATQNTINADNDEEVARRLDSWKEYVIKEKKFRDEGGLSERVTQSDTKNEVPVPRSDRQARAETRKKINKMSIEALESLMATSDPARREKLQREVDFLKAELEGKDYLDFEEPEEYEPVQPVDMRGVFSRSEETRKPRPAEERRALEKSLPVESRASNNVEPYTVNPSQPSSPPPNAPFFSEADDLTTSKESKPAPPRTPFFSESEESGEYASAVPSDSKLGSFEEQKLAAMYRRAGARTSEEQERVKAGWLEYQQIEKEKRKLSGLDEARDGNAEIAGLASKFNVSEVMKDDGDFDAAKILSAIGPRPKRGAKSATASTVPGDSLSEGSAAAQKTVGKQEVASSLYRSVSAVGGDRFKDNPEAKAKDQEEFQSYLEKEAELRRSLDESAENPTEGEVVQPDAEFNIDEYADDVLSSLGPRPKPRRQRKVDPREFSDMGGVLASEDVEFSGPKFPETPDPSSDMPEWLRKENEEANKPNRKRKTFLGEEVEEAFDDDQYDKNMRQLAEYERRRAGKQASMGIDITEVLGRRSIDDYKDYMYDQNMYAGGRRGWGVASFEDRKRNLIEYTELDLAEVNSLMDHRDSVHSTGVSQYTRRINKPFEAFAAIFRLEGVFADISCMHEKVWTEVAEMEGLRIPDADEIRRASVVRPESAPRDVFVWTDDFIEASRIGRVFRERFDVVFDVWAKENDLIEEQPVGQASQAKGNLAIGEDLFSDSRQAAPTLNLPQDERALLELLFRIWSQVAFDNAKPVPTESQIQQAALVTPDIAVQQVFRWTKDVREASALITQFETLLRKVSGNGPNYVATIEQPSPKRSQPKEAVKIIDQVSLMEAHYVAWTNVAASFHFDKPSPDEVLGAYVLNDPIVAVRDGFAWTREPDMIARVVDQFSSELNDAIRGWSGSNSASKKTESRVSTQNVEINQPSYVQSNTGNPSFEEILEMNKKAWKIAAASHGFKSAPDEFVKLSLNMDPSDVIVRVFRWTWEGSQVSAIAKTFQENLKKESEAFASKYKITLQEPVSDNAAVTTEETVSKDAIFKAAFNSWTATAEVHNLPRPSKEQVLFAMSVGPEVAISNAFKWTTDVEAAWWIMETYKEKIQSEREKLNLDELTNGKSNGNLNESPLVSVISGCSQWIKSLKEYEMQCGVISHLRKKQVAALLKFTKLDELFDQNVQVSYDNGYRSDSQQMLGAALRLERRPDHCVVFDSSPYASLAAHDVEMQSVGIIGSYPRYELLSADTTASGFQELTAFNIRRLFGERIFDQPELDRQQADPSIVKKVKTAFDWNDE